ncbi:MAG: hypothetical protein ACQCN6_10255 [Candidatus Bathyarchaeia archaeon]|jgi:hypothetical protein
MTEEHFDEYICRFVQEHKEFLRKYLLNAYESKDRYLCYLDSSLGTPVPSEDIRNLEFLTEAKLFKEEAKFNRDGRNRYKMFTLTEMGQRMAQHLKAEGYNGEPRENPEII